MTEPIKVYRTQAFTPIVEELVVFGAMFRAEANAVFGAELTDAALARKVCEEIETRHGLALILSARGRTMAGFTGYFKMTVENIENCLCLRDAYLNIVQLSGKIENVQRKRRVAVIYTKDDKRILALVSASGFNRTVIRKIYKGEVLSSEYSELHLYTYLPKLEVLKLADLLLNPENETALKIDTTRLRLFSIKPWPQANQAEQPRV